VISVIFGGGCGFGWRFPSVALLVAFVMTLAPAVRLLPFVHAVTGLDSKTGIKGISSNEWFVSTSAWMLRMRWIFIVAASRGTH